MIYLVAHDAGGAELVSSWARRRGEPNLRLVAEGPAAGIFARKMPGLRNEPRSVLGAIHPQDFVLTGTGWASDLERRGIEVAKDKGARVASFLDHWVNYEKRFSLLPDEVWVGDAYAEALARRVFPSLKIKLVENPYIAELRESIPSSETSSSPKGPAKVLYVCEAISEHLGQKLNSPKNEYELKAIGAWLAWAENKRVAIAKMRLRLHPAESADKYAELLLAPGCCLEISHNANLVDDLAWSDFVVGMNSMALFAAAELGKETYSCLPDSQLDFALPHKKITRIRCS